jgi:membrane protease YdiL (CAAX protease family)
MEANLAAPEVERAPAREFPYSNWGAGAAILGVVLALGAGILLGIPAAFLPTEDDGDLSTGANVLIQLATALGFLLTPMAIAAWRGAAGLGEILARLGVRRFAPWPALKWMAAAVGAYFVFAALYSLLITPPEQEDIAEAFGPLPVQILLIVIAAPLSEELLFRGYLFGGLREKLSRWPAALIAGAIFGALHALTGISAVPQLIAFGVILCLLYEKTGSIVPGIILHLLNNSAALLAQ